MSELILTMNQVVPNPPSTGGVSLYAKTDGKLYSQNALGVETLVGSGSGGSGATTFIQLTDAPQSYANANGKYVTVNSTGTGLVFSSPPTQSFINLSDAPHAYGTAGQLVAIDSAGTGLTFVNASSGSATFTGLTDVPHTYGTAGQYVVINSTADGLTFTNAPSGGSSSFITLTDAPHVYGTAGQVVTVNSTGNGLIFSTPFGGSFTTLTDAPHSYTGKAGYTVQVNSTATGLTLVKVTSGGATTFTSLTDAPQSYLGYANNVVAVNSTASGLTFTTVPLKFEFTITFGASNPSTISNLPNGWSSSIAGSVVTITHNVGTPPAGIAYFGLNTISPGTQVWRYRLPSAVNELNYPSTSVGTQFSFTVSTSVVACDSNGTARVVVNF